MPNNFFSLAILSKLILPSVLFDSSVPGFSFFNFPPTFLPAFLIFFVTLFLIDMKFELFGLAQDSLVGSIGGSASGALV